MLPQGCIPRVTASYSSVETENPSLLVEPIKNILRKILPEDIFTHEDILKKNEFFQTDLPLVRHKLSSDKPGFISFYVLHYHREDAFKFFYEMATRWLVPGKRLNPIHVYAADFNMPEISKNFFTVNEITIQVDSMEDLIKIHQNLSMFESELKIGIESSYHARRILEVKGLSTDEKISRVQEEIAYLTRRLPQYFTMDLLSEMQQILMISREEFKDLRNSRHLSRIITAQYLHRKWLRECVKLFPEKRHIALKLMRTRLVYSKGKYRNVLGVAIGINFLRDKEVFEKKNLLAAMQKYIPLAQAVKDSFFANRKGEEQICTYYLEIDKEDGSGFTLQEIKTLQEALPVELKDRIECLLPPVFMPRNEEEVMHNVLNLGSQLRYIRDIPQLTISFDEQTDSNLFFTVILVRVTKPDAPSIQHLVSYSDTYLTYIHDRVKNLGYLRNKYLKEATVFRVKIAKERFLRKNNSIDLYKARQAVFEELSRVLGELRDFNGGMISKQNEILCTLRELIGKGIKSNDLLLENFFYSLTPVIMRTVLQPETLKTLFLMHVEMIEDAFFIGEGPSLRIKCEEDFVFALVKAEDRLIKEELAKIFTRLKISSADLANSYVKIYDAIYIGYIYRCDDPQKQRQFCQIVHNITETWEGKRQRRLLLEPV